MNEDYLWDKSGERDPEIERLEAALASLRYKRPARPLPLPVAATRPSFRLNSMWLAAAAAVALLIFAGGLWLAFHRSNSNEQIKEMAGGAASKTNESPKDATTSPTKSASNSSGQIADDKKRGESSGPVKSPAPSNLNLHRQPAERRQVIALGLKNRERVLHEEETNRRGELAKEQLIKALQITSDKLNTVQKKIQGNQEHNPIS